MSRLIFMVVCLLCETAYFQTSAQHSKVIKIPTKYSQEGVIFDSLYSTPILLRNLLSRFTPSLKEISIVEDVLEENYSNSLANCYRQYLGYTNTEGRKVVIAQLLNSKIKKRQHVYIEPWKYEFLNGFGEFYEANVRLHYIDLKLKKLL